MQDDDVPEFAAGADAREGRRADQHAGQGRRFKVADVIFYQVSESAGAYRELSPRGVASKILEVPIYSRKKNGGTPPPLWDGGGVLLLLKPPTFFYTPMTK